MALRKYMHPRNKYKEGPDFKQLAILYPDFRAHTMTDLSGKLRYNFKNKESLRVLAQTLLKHDFDLDVEIPSENLVPVMPLRLNYVLWIEDLVKYAKLTGTGEIHGIDIGTGAVCIYPLLCSKLYGWRMFATEIDERSIASASKNIAKNGLSNLIRVIHIKDEKTILFGALKESEDYSFAMCNPPFFNADEIVKREKRLPPRNASTGNKFELAVEGGEKTFVTRLIRESETLRERVKIYTTMLGQRSSCAFFRSELKKRKITNATWTEFCQGHTKRWGLAWTFLSKDIIDLTKAPVIRTREICQTIEQTKNRPSEIVFPLSEKFPNVDQLVDTLKTWIRKLKIEMEELDVATKEFAGWTCRLRAYEDTWSHARRKRRMEERRESSSKKPRFEDPEAEKSNEDCVGSGEDPEAASSSAAIFTNSLLECSLIVGKLKCENTADRSEQTIMVKVCILYEGGHGGKNALETFRQYLINKLNIRDYLLSKSGSKRLRKKRRKDKRIEPVVSRD